MILFCIFNAFKEVFHFKNQESKSTEKHYYNNSYNSNQHSKALCLFSCNLKLAFRGIASFGPSDILNRLRRVMLLLYQSHSWQKQSICRLGKQLAFRVRLQGASLTFVTDLKQGVRGMWSEPFLFPFGSG